jgi:hypothetical protein
MVHEHVSVALNSPKAASATKKSAARNTGAQSSPSGKD